MRLIFVSGVSPERWDNMATIRWSVQARKDLEIISDYYQEVSPSYAERFEEQILETTRKLIYREYRIMYHVDDTNEEVLILTVIHSSRQFGE